MKNIVIALLGIAVIGLSALCVRQSAAQRQTEERLRAAEQAWRAEPAVRTEQAEQIRTAEALAERLQREVHEFSSVTSRLRSNESSQQSNLVAMAEQLKRTNQPTAGAGGISGREMGDMISKMMKKPATQK